MTEVRLNIEKTPAQVFSRQLVWIKQIQHIQLDLDRAGAPHFDRKITFLNQSYIFHLVAFWQVFIEDLVEFGFGMLERSTPPGVFRDIARAHLDARLRRFNTPNRDNIDTLFKECLGIPRISRPWDTVAVGEHGVAQFLNDLLRARHQIAHEGYAEAELSFSRNFEQMEKLFRLAEVTERALLDFIGQSRADDER